MNIICISTGSRPALIRQTIDSMRTNALRWQDHTLTLVVDGFSGTFGVDIGSTNTAIISKSRQGASASRNIGAGSIPRASRHRHVMFVDDDCYFLPHWAESLNDTIQRVMPLHIVSGYAHPFNHPVDTHYPHFDLTGVVSTVAMVMPWKLWDITGQYFELPGGAGGSEDVELCYRAVAAGASLAITKPQCVIHCGLTSSTGKPIVGAKELAELNQSIILKHGLAGRVLQQ